jgi:hypothetical protein
MYKYFIDCPLLDHLQGPSQNEPICPKPSVWMRLGHNLRPTKAPITVCPRSAVRPTTSILAPNIKSIWGRKTLSMFDLSVHAPLVCLSGAVPLPLPWPPLCRSCLPWPQEQSLHHSTDCHEHCHIDLYISLATQSSTSVLPPGAPPVSLRPQFVRLLLKPQFSVKKCKIL